MTRSLVSVARLFALSLSVVILSGCQNGDSTEVAKNKVEKETQSKKEPPVRDASVDSSKDSNESQATDKSDDMVSAKTESDSSGGPAVVQTEKSDAKKDSGPALVPLANGGESGTDKKETDETSIKPLKPLTTLTDSKSHGQWMVDLKKAQAKAKAEKKDILMNFTGSDWCRFCIMLEREVFSKKAFEDYAKENFVLVMVDFPRDDSAMSAETIQQNEELQAKFDVEGFPTILLTDADGRPFYKTGYQPGGPEPYVEHLTELKTARVERDKAFAAAAKLEGVKRAEKLSEGLEAIDSQLLFPTYEKEVEEIVKLDADDKGGLKNRYVKMLEMQQYEQIASKIIDIANETQDLKAIHAAFAEPEKKYAKNPEFLRQLNMLKLRVYDFLDEGKLKMELLDKLLAEKDLEPELRMQFMIGKLSAHAQAEEFDKALPIVNELVTKFKDEVPAEQLANMLIMKARILKELKQLDKVKTVLDEARKAAGPQYVRAIDRIEQDLLPKTEKKEDSSDGDSKKAEGTKKSDSDKTSKDAEKSEDSTKKSTEKKPTAEKKPEEKKTEDKSTEKTSVDDAKSETKEKSES